MRLTRLIARLDVKGPNLIKGVHLEGLRIIGAPEKYAKKYYEHGADEIIYMDVVASLYGRSKLTEIVRRTAHDVFVPLTVGGGISSVDDVQDLLCVGADKVAINTAALADPSLINRITRRFGSQSLVLSIEAKRQSEGSWSAYSHCGREKSGWDVIEWAKEGVKLGAGEILITSIDQEGTRKGFDLELVKAISSAVKVPIIASGGYGAPQHLVDVIKFGKANAVAFADSIHYERATFNDFRQTALENNISVRVI
ncbi:imidazole glycerol phosphate synthase subunit HisF [Polynucleobacter sp. Adler-ghost]|uniref:imidazole glycerol phosphate synthase subunit HisF n=1 Tax=Polynucleobacter sp. Adler-ghost TaxID=2770234 RepID=UPI001BFD4FD1|nr:imidazole glycerol phosphate synthase cyclase subunit [Polynucleobacter sp. Adler-ghost]QWE31042.1 imidazole glycerol phosphate synthase subunit HisF [Polynucleobacter sp. Adler-ghost]